MVLAFARPWSASIIFTIPFGAGAGVAYSMGQTRRVAIIGGLAAQLTSIIFTPILVLALWFSGVIWLVPVTETNPPFQKLYFSAWVILLIVVSVSIGCVIGRFVGPCVTLNVPTKSGKGGHC